MMDTEEYKHLQRLDTRKALFPNELGDEWQAELAKGYQGKGTPELDDLL